MCLNCLPTDTHADADAEVEDSEYPYCFRSGILMFKSRVIGLIDGLGDRDGDENWVPRVFKAELPMVLREHAELMDFKEDAWISGLLSRTSSFFVIFVMLDLEEASRLSRPVNDLLGVILVYGETAQDPEDSRCVCEGVSALSE
jgi:hypothetical protein